jgi:hypothetical protein
MSAHAYVFDARLADDPDVRRTVAVGSDQTLDDVRGPDDGPLPRVLERHGEIALEPEAELGVGD